MCVMPRAALPGRGCGGGGAISGAVAVAATAVRHPLARSCACVPAGCWVDDVRKAGRLTPGGNCCCEASPGRMCHPPSGLSSRGAAAAAGAAGASCAAPTRSSVTPRSSGAMPPSPGPRPHTSPLSSSSSLIASGAVVTVVGVSATRRCAAAPVDSGKGCTVTGGRTPVSLHAAAASCARPGASPCTMGSSSGSTGAGTGVCAAHPLGGGKASPKAPPLPPPGDGAGMGEA